MTAINFPANPSNGDTHQGFVYNSTLGVWQSAGTQTAVTSFTGLSDTPSTLGTAGQIAKVNSGATALEFADQSGVTVYANVDALPGTGNTGDLAFVTATNRLYLWNGSGWYNIALINTTPSISGVNSSYDLAIDGTPTVITITAVDAEGLPITYSIASDTSGNIATVTQGTGANTNVFTITPSTTEADAGTFSLTFRASDGVNIASSIASFELAFQVVNTNYTTALITSVGGNNAVNNSFVDSSTNSHTITVAGNATQTTFSPYRHGGYSAFFGTGVEYLSVAPDASFTFGTGDFTIEGWAYLLATGDRGFFQQATSLFPTSSVNSLAVQTTASGTKWAIYAGNTQHIAATATYSLNQWYHWAMVRESSVTKLYIDGVEVISISDTTDYTGTYFGIGQLYGTGVGNNLNGYLTDVRVVKGTALYTSAFTPPTERLTAVANTSLLTCHLPYFVDGSTNGHTITNTGVTAQPFAPYDYLEYAAADHGGSIHFDGSGDKLTIPGTYANFGTNPFTVEAWVYPTTANGPIFTTHRAGTASGFYFSMSTTNNTLLHGRYFSSNVETASPANVVKLNEWNHFAWCREGTGSNQTRMFANGKVVATYTDDQDYSSAPYGPYVGGYDAGGTQYDVNGNIADLRVVSGTAVYTADFTPPTAPLTAITNTSLLVNGTNAGIIDKSQSVETITLNGNVSSSTTQSKYLTSSMYFDGTGDSLDLYGGLGDFGTGDFTIELWAYASAMGTYPYLIEARNSGSQINTWTLSFNYMGNVNNDILQFASFNGSTATAFLTSNTAFSTTTWTHVAVTRTGTTMKMFLDGTEVASNTSAGFDFTLSQNPIHVGKRFNSINYWNGYMSDIRITKGLARYTANFTPPTAELKG